jgi:hypothetical protein
MGIALFFKFFYHLFLLTFASNSRTINKIILSAEKIFAKAFFARKMLKFSSFSHRTFAKKTKKNFTTLGGIESRGVIKKKLQLTFGLWGP